MNITDSQFWKSIQILVNNFHALNKKIFSCNLETCWKLKYVPENFRDVFLKADNSLECKDLWKSSGIECMIDSVNHLQKEEQGKHYDGFGFVFKLLMKNGKEAIEGIGFIGKVFKLITIKTIKTHLIF